MRKLTVLLLMIMLLCSAAVAEDVLSIDAPDAVIRPGKAATISFTAPEAGVAEILLKDM